MCHPDTPDDTLFIVAEEDFRLQESHGGSAGPDDLLDWEARPSTTAASSSGARGSGWWGPAGELDASAGTPFPEQVLGEESSEINYRLQARAVKGRQPDIAAQCDPSLRDLVKYASAAHRAKVGDLIWCTWCGTHQRPGTPSHGTTLVMISKSGAHILNSKVKTITDPTHWDVWLSKFLLNKEESRTLRSSFIWPSIGSFCQHVSGCEVQYAVEERPTEWAAKWVGPGTRGVPDKCDKGRWICSFDKDDRWKKLVPTVELDATVYQWKTWASTLEGKDAADPETRTKWRNSAFSALHPPGPWKGPESDRHRREMTRHLGLFARRCFITGDAEVHIITRLCIPKQMREDDGFRNSVVLQFGVSTTL
jgi:hypothetical protein